MSKSVSLLLLAAYALFGWWLWKKSRPDDIPDDIPDFEFLSVQEQIETVKQTSDALSDLENLQTELQGSTGNDILPVHLEWMSRDGTMHALEIYCTGTDTATDSLYALAETEIHDARQTLTYQCETLAKRTRSRKNSRKNGMGTGGEDIEEVLQQMRRNH